MSFYQCPSIQDSCDSPQTWHFAMLRATIVIISHKVTIFYATNFAKTNIKTTFA